MLPGVNTRKTNQSNDTASENDLITLGEEEELSRHGSPEGHSRGDKWFSL